MLTKTGPKLLDFGLAKLHGAASPVSLSGETNATTAGPITTKGIILGTIHYMAPEQVEGREADSRSDIWALGVLLYEMATGQRPFSGESAASIVGAILKDTPPAIATRRPLTPASLEHLVEQCLAKDPEERWQDVRDVTRELSWIASAPSRTNATSPPTHLPVRRAIGPWILAVSLLIAAAVGGMLLLRTTPRAAEPERTPVSIVPPDTVRPSGAFALSPDGRHFAFVGLATEGPPLLWLRAMGDGSVQQLPGTEDASYPFWSPRGDAIGFFAGSKLKTIGIAGGVVKTLAPALSARGGSWNADGTILFAPQNSAILSVSDKSGPVTPVTSIDAPRRQRGHRWPMFIDQRRFVYAVQGDAASTGIYMGSLDSPAQTRLANAYSNAVVVNDRLLYVSEGALVAQPLDMKTRLPVGDPQGVIRSVSFSGGLGRAAFSVSASGTLAYTVGGEMPSSDLRWLDRQGRHLGQFGANTILARSEAYSQAMSPDGRTVAVAVFQSANADLWTIDVARGVASRFTFDEAGELTPVWSPDSTQMLFSSNRDGFYNLYRKSTSGSGADRLLFTSPSHQYATDWSRDGSTILFTNMDAKTQADLWMAPANEGGVPTPVLVTSFNEYNGRLSPDGRWIAYTSDESGRPEVYVQQFPVAAGKVQVSTQGGSEPAWRADGRELFYLAANRTLTVVSVTTSPTLSTGQSTKVFDTTVDSNQGNIHAIHHMATADGQRFLVNVSTTNQVPTTVILNWQSLLRK